ncbi:hypothetical protein JYU34_005115 [Plutella xylostella]|uniref:Uncharacterized protein n=1 Tax=Plutella xylostella TaxID=51655 RepID=A0ABQ7QVW2_PLUXY|nr:hypothetical protein JYU34_005115 [Plutella xylostella]
MTAAAEPTRVALPAVPRLGLFFLAFFIFISASSAANAESRRCHWCGPLAEQVHRSRRAPPCPAQWGGGEPETLCEEGFQYCAVVATAPPHVESRFCVKLYQDECYPIYCNTTKTWKMTCPCRGDLCNGANTEREEDAFAALARLVAKTHRIKKRLVQEDDDSVHIVNNATTAAPLSHEHSNKDENKENETLDKAEAKPPTVQTEANTINIRTSTDDKIRQVMNEKAMDDNRIDTNIPTMKPMHNEVIDIEIDLKMVEVTTMAAPASVAKQEDVKSTMIVKPTEQVIAAESLQQNTSPKAKEDPVTEPTTTEGTTQTVAVTTMHTTTMMATMMDVKHAETTESTMEKKNNGIRLSSNMVVLLISFSFIKITF